MTVCHNVIISLSNYFIFKKCSLEGGVTHPNRPPPPPPPFLPLFAHGGRPPPIKALKNTKISKCEHLKNSSSNSSSSSTTTVFSAGEGREGTKEKEEEEEEPSVEAAAGNVYKLQKL